MSAIVLFRIRILGLAAIFAVACSQIAYAGSNQFTVGLVISAKKETGQSRTRFTCNAAMSKVRLGGFTNVQMKNCNGDVYQFVGDNGSGLQNIDVNAYTGELSVI